MVMINCREMKAAEDRNENPAQTFKNQFQCHNQEKKHTNAEELQVVLDKGDQVVCNHADAP